MSEVANASPPASASVMQWALAYARHGWSVIPLRPHDKRPLVAWTAFQQQRASAEQIEDWFQRAPNENLGIVTGRISGLLVLDIDMGHGGDDSLALLERRHGMLPAAPTVVTGGGGRHVYFAHLGGQVPNRAGIMPGLDLRGDGGYVVAPPSIHPSGNPYRWLEDCGFAEVPLPIMPAWLRQICGLTRRMGHPPEHWRTLAAAGVQEGARNSNIASFAGHLLWHGVDPEVVLQLMLSWNRCRCRPPLGDSEVARIVASIGKLHERPLAEVQLTQVKAGDRTSS